MSNVWVNFDLNRKTWKEISSRQFWFFSWTAKINSAKLKVKYRPFYSFLSHVSVSCFHNWKIHLFSVYYSAFRQNKFRQIASNLGDPPKFLLLRHNILYFCEVSIKRGRSRTMAWFLKVNFHYCPFDYRNRNENREMIVGMLPQEVFLSGIRNSN